MTAGYLTEFCFAFWAQADWQEKEIKERLQLELSMMFTHPREGKLLSVLHSCDLQTNKEISLLKMYKSSNSAFSQGANCY